ncbi:MAG TPA: hypothetical protein VFI02_18300 [Armatimonadota bacterium]|nr:hypothetical protein [Armatimonadota bacterium]
MSEPEQTPEDRFRDAALGILFLLVGLLILFMAVVSLVRRESGWTPMVAIGAVWMILVLIGAGISHIGCWRKWRWAGRLGRMALILGLAGIAIIVVGGLLRSPTTLAHGLIEVLMAWWIGFGLFLYLSARRSGKPKEDIATSPAIIAIWPLLFVLRGSGGMILLLVPIIVLSGVYLILYKLGCHYAGVVLSTALVIALIGLGCRRR